MKRYTLLREIIKILYFVIFGTYLVYTRNTSQEILIINVVLAMIFCTTFLLYMARIATELLNTILKPDTE